MRTGRHGVIDIGDVEDAARRLDGVSNKTPLLRHSELDEMTGAAVFLKPEMFQSIGSFKIRGAYNLMSQLSPDQASRGVVAWSSGNHAQGVALAGKLLGIPATIVMPEDAPAAKLDNTRRLGGEVITYDRYSEDREAIARTLAAERNAALVPSYDHPQIIAGQGTVGLEIAEESLALGMPVEKVLIPCGGGGLSAGSAIALRSRLPDVDIHTVEPEHYDDTARSLLQGERTCVSQATPSICDALLAGSPGRQTFDILRDLTADGLVVDEAEVRHAMRWAFRHLKLVVEPGGAVALAALLAGKVDVGGQAVAAVLSGGNVDPVLFDEIQTEPA
jgi:threonine dehydratase